MQLYTLRDLRDKTGSFVARARAFNESIATMDAILEPDGDYAIKGARVMVSPTGKCGAMELVLDAKDCTVTRIDDGDGQPAAAPADAAPYHLASVGAAAGAANPPFGRDGGRAAGAAGAAEPPFAPFAPLRTIADLPTLASGAAVSVVGLVQDVRPMENIDGDKGDSSKHRRAVVLVDDSGRALMLLLWGDLAWAPGERLLARFKEGGPSPVLAALELRVTGGDAGGPALSLASKDDSFLVTETTEGQILVLPGQKVVLPGERLPSSAVRSRMRDLAKWAVASPGQVTAASEAWVGEL